MATTRSPYYALRDGGLTWLVSIDPRLGDLDGKPILARIARAARINRARFTMVVNGHYRLGGDMKAALCKLAQDAGQDRSVIEVELFVLIEGETAADDGETDAVRVLGASA